MKFYIYANSYNDNSGGSIVLHRLCHIINKHTNHNAYLVKMDPLAYGAFSLKKILSKIKWELKNKKAYKINDVWDTPVWNSEDFPDDCIVIYPEIINGNPLKINNVVRWFLHQPGFHTKYIKYGKGELYYKFNSAIDDFTLKDSKLSSHELKVIYYPIDVYNDVSQTSITRDIECSYLIRKGKNKKFVHSRNAVQIDGLSHHETASILKRTKIFISYDDYTAYSIFAIMCGCKSYVVPSEDKSLISWYPNESDRFGISYGFSAEQEIWAEKTKHKVLEHINQEHQKSILNVKICTEEMIDFF